jgi:hypothetical protein
VNRPRRWTGKQALARAVIDRDLRVELGVVDRRIAGLHDVDPLVNTAGLA